LGTAAGCARLLGLDAAQTLAALSIAFSMASGSRKQFGSMMKPIHAGLAAKNAVLAARMAQAGIEGNAEPVGGQWGFAELYGASDREDATKSLAPNDAGQRLAIETDGLMAKRFPCCAAAHRTLDGLAELQAQYRFPLESVERVDAWVPAFARANLRFDDPQNEMEARFSLPYCAVRVLQTGRLSLSDMTREKVREEAIRPWLQRIVIHTKPGSVSDELGERATPAVTRVTLEGRRVHEIGVLAPKGSRCVPLTEAEQLAKFRDCCAWAGAEREAERLFALARSISRLSRFGEFSEALTGA
jgi:2-methylcitrate dehydratase PrpD